MPKICQSDGAAASSNNEAALPNNQTETCSDSLTSVLSNRCSDDGIEVQEGVGCWMHWVSSDPTRLKALKERAIAKLVVNYGDQHRGERYRNASINNNGRMRRTSAYFKSGWKHYTSFDLDVKYSREDAIVSYLTRRQIGVQNLDTVLVQFDELLDYSSAKSTFRLVERIHYASSDLSLRSLYRSRYKHIQLEFVTYRSYLTTVYLWRYATNISFISKIVYIYSS